MGDPELVAALQPVVVVAWGLLGLCVGSFVNVLIYRLPRERSVVTPRSHCFCCGTELACRDLIPILSLLLAGRRCRYCGVALSAQYSLVEAACGLLFAALAWRWGPGLALVGYSLAAAALVAAAGTDLRYTIIPASLNVAVGLAGLLVAVGAAAAPAWVTADATLAGHVPSPAAALLGGLTGYLVFESIVRLGRWLFRQEAMGGGDVQLAIGVGLLTGWSWSFLTFFVASIGGGAVLGLGLLASGRLRRGDPMPFGPYMVVGILLVLLCPEATEFVRRMYSLGG